MTMRLGEATLGPGTISEDVKQMQMILVGQGYNVGPIDGNFGPMTVKAVQAFQKTKGLIPDGIVGPLTWDALRGKTSAPALPPTVPAPPPMVSAQKSRGMLEGVMTPMVLGLLGIGIILSFKR